MTSSPPQIIIAAIACPFRSITSPKSIPIPLHISPSPQKLRFSTRIRCSDGNGVEKISNRNKKWDEEEYDLGVKVALSMLKFYRREISPLMMSSCRYVPTCSQYSMEAYKKYGVVKGTILTAWHLCRCNPLGGSGLIHLGGLMRKKLQNETKALHKSILCNASC